MTTNKVSSESPFYFQLIHVNNIWNIKTVFMQSGYRLQWYGIFPPFLIRYLAQLGLLVRLDVRSMNEVCNLTALYFFLFFSLLYYKHINFAKCDDISVI